MSHQIIACIDDSASAPGVCDWSAWTSQRLDAPLTLLHVLDRTNQLSAADLSGNIGLGTREHLLEELTKLDEQRGKLALEQGKVMLEDAKKRVEQAGVSEVTTRQRHDDLIRTLTELEADIRLLVMGRQGKSTQSMVTQVGSQLESAIRTLHCPILVALPHFKVPQNVMIAYDASPTSRKILSLMLANPKLLKGIKCHLVMVGDDPKGHLEAAHRILTKSGFDVVAALRRGELESTLQNYVKEQEIDLMVMGAYGHSAIRRFILGSHTTKMLSQTQIPLLLLR
jgi:nucleotide-binding universal stress UspA family protein